MAAWLPMVAFGLGYGALPVADWRVRFVWAALLWGVLVTLITESVGFGRGALVIAWALVVVGLLVRARPRRVPTPAAPDAWVFLVGVGVLCAGTLLVGLVAPPNTFDALTYHMSRVAHWAANGSPAHGSPAHYPTNDLRQLYQHPWAEYAITHLYVLGGGDRLANAVQWFGYVGSSITAAYAAGVLGAGRWGQWLAAIFTATVPMAVLQASGAQNDAVTMLWLLCLVVFVARLVRGETGWHVYVGVGLSLGLLLLTKATGYIYALPLCVIVGVYSLRRRVLFVRGVMCAGLALVLLSGHGWRNTHTFGSPFGPHAGEYTNEALTLPLLASNVVRNTALHVVLPDVLRPTGEAAVERLHGWLGVRVDDPRSTFLDASFALPAWTMHEDLAPAPFHLLLVGVALVLAWRVRHPPALLLLAAWLGAVLLFNSLLKWQPWHSRLHLPLWGMIAPFVGYVLTRAGGERAVKWVVVGLLLAALFPLLLNTTRPLVGERAIWHTPRTDLYFAAIPAQQPDYVAVADALQAAGCDRVGLAIGSAAEYPLWVLLPGARFYHLETPYIAHAAHENEKSVCAVVTYTNDTFQLVLR